jgi:alkanesulfonate monooxygenase SsuD/methylene tetrahydromethanopterin reductase-like flavin-dependent oxidoreductase (luciferase family)
VFTLLGYLAAVTTRIGLGLGLDDEPGRPGDWLRRLDELRALGATHVTIRAGGADTIGQQLDRLIECKRVLDAG